MRHRFGRAACALAGLGLVLAACGDDGDGGGSRVRVRVDEIRPAIAAVEALLGGPQRFSEVNVTPSEVNVFVVHDGLDVAYVVRDGGVEPPTGAGVAYDGPTFAAGDLAFESSVLDVVIDELPDSEVAAFSITPTPRGGVEYIATVRGESAELRVLLDAAGRVVATA